VQTVERVIRGLKTFLGARQLSPLDPRRPTNTTVGPKTFRNAPTTKTRNVPPRIGFCFYKRVITTAALSRVRRVHLRETRAMTNGPSGERRYLLFYFVCFRGFCSRPEGWRLLRMERSDAPAIGRTTTSWAAADSHARTRCTFTDETAVIRHRSYGVGTHAYIRILYNYGE